MPVDSPAKEVPFIFTTVDVLPTLVTSPVRFALVVTVAARVAVAALSDFLKYGLSIIEVSEIFNLMANLLVKFNKLVSDKLDLALMRFDKETPSVTSSFVANLLVKFNKLVSDKLDLALMRFDKEAVSV